MNTEELAHVFDGLAKGLGASLRDKEKKELAAVVGMFRRFPNQSVGDFTKFVEGAFSRERNSVPALVERIRACQQGAGEPYSELRQSLAGIGANDLKKVVIALGGKAGKKEDNLQLLDSQLSNGRNGSIAQPASNGFNADVDRAYAQYEAIKADLRNITVQEMRARFAAISNLPKPVLAGVLARLGYPADGGKEEIEHKLLDNLTSIKISYDQTRQIGG